jgi:uncharacterized protein YutE (UPF0331/DUF86 family)
MTVDQEILAARIARIRENLKLLDRLPRVGLEAFRASQLEQHATERELLVAIEACLDIAHHVVAREALRRPTDHRDLFRILAEAGVISTDLSARLEKMAGFRNMLVHAYLQVDPAEVFRIATTDFRDIEAYVQTVVMRFGPKSE